MKADVLILEFVQFRQEYISGFKLWQETSAQNGVISLEGFEQFA